MSCPVTGCVDVQDNESVRRPVPSVSCVDVQFNGAYHHCVSMSLEKKNCNMEDPPYPCFTFLLSLIRALNCDIATLYTLTQGSHTFLPKNFQSFSRICI